MTTVSSTQNQPIQDDDNPIQQAIEQWVKMQAQQKADLALLMTAIQDMLALVKAHKTDQAFAMAQQTVMTDTMTVKGDDMGMLAASMNISSAFQSDATAMQNDLNTCARAGQDDPKAAAAAQDFAKRLQRDYAYVNSHAPWMDQSTADNLASSLTKTAQEFGPKVTPDNLPPNFADDVQKDMYNWTNAPTIPDTGVDPKDPTLPLTGQQHIQNIQADQTQTNNAEAAQSQSLTAQEQFASNTFNQYMNTCKDVLQSNQTEQNTIVQNMGKQ